jgi:hypothetical protein
VSKENEKHWAGEGRITEFQDSLSYTVRPCLRKGRREEERKEGGGGKEKEGGKKEGREERQKERGVAQVVECPPSKLEALNSNPSITKKE